LQVFDDKIEVIFPDVYADGENKLSILLKKNEPLLNNLKYKLAHTYESNGIYGSIPCTQCPVYRECGVDNKINPKECPHLQDFLKLF